MYINPFLAGVLITVIAEIVIIMTYAVIAYYKNKHNGGNK